MPIADFEQAVDSTLGAIHDSDAIDERNKEILTDYKRDLVLRGLSVATILRNLSRLKVLARDATHRPFDEMDERDVREMLEWVYSQDYTDETIDTYKNVIKSFWKWLEDTDEHPDAVDWIEINGSNANDTLPKDLLTPTEVRAQIDACNNARDKALVAMLWETGARIGELIDLTVGDIEDRPNGRKVVIEGKTGARRLPLVESVPYLNTWLGEHPNPEKDAPLWCKIQQGGPVETLTLDDVDGLEDIHGIGDAIAARLREAGIETPSDLVGRSAADIAAAIGVAERRAQGWLDQFDPGVYVSADDALDYQYIRTKILRRSMADAGIDKPSNPHHYRHSRASYLATRMTEAELCGWFGWVQGSDVPARYVHLSGRDIDRKYDQIHGLAPPDDETDEPDVQVCPRCEELNRPEAGFCDRCGQVLDIDAAEELETAEGETISESKSERVDRLLEELDLTAEEILEAALRTDE